MRSIIQSRLTRKTSQRRRVAFFVRLARWTFANNGLFGNVDALAFTVNASLLVRALGIGSATDSCKSQDNNSMNHLVRTFKTS